MRLGGGQRPLARAAGAQPAIVCPERLQSPYRRHPGTGIESRAGKTKTARLWVYARDDRAWSDPSPPAVWYQYSENRKGENPRRHLSGFAGVLQADAYAGYDRIFADGQIVEAACWAHCRRKFYEVHERQDHALGTVAHQALVLIGKLYAIEQEVRGRPADERHGYRQAHARPLLVQLHGWLKESLCHGSALWSQA